MEVRGDGEMVGGFFASFRCGRGKADVCVRIVAESTTTEIAGGGGEFVTAIRGEGRGGLVLVGICRIVVGGRISRRQ